MTRCYLFRHYRSVSSPPDEVDTWFRARALAIEDIDAHGSEASTQHQTLVNSMDRMEDFQLDIVSDQGPNARSIRLDLPKFTLIGATTRSGLLSAPLLSRFTVKERLDHYTAEELTTILLRSSRVLEVPLEGDAALKIAECSRGTPRIANNLLRRVRDYAQVRHDGVISVEVVGSALEMLEIDANGLNEMDKRILRCIAEHFGGGPVGIKTMALAVGEEPETIEHVHEPFLISKGLLSRTPQGRILTPNASRILGAQ